MPRWKCRFTARDARDQVLVLDSDFETDAPQGSADWLVHFRAATAAIGLRVQQMDIPLHDLGVNILRFEDRVVHADAGRD